MKQHRPELWKLFVSASTIVLSSQVMLLGDAHSQTDAQKDPPAKAASKPRAKQVAAVPTHSLSINTFLEQVTKGNDAYKAAEMNRKGAEAYASEASLVLAPTLFANASQGYDAKPSPFASFGLGYSHVDQNQYQAGISKQFEMGLTTKFTYTASDTHYVPLSSQYFEARPQVEATFSLLRNFLGRETRGQIDSGRLNAMAKAQEQNAIAKGALSEAEGAYWRLALAREALKVSKDSVDRARALSDWTGRRERLALSDSSESLQSTAQLKARELDYKQAEDDERSARLAFNSSRGISSDKVPESLEVLNASLVSKWETPNRTQTNPTIEAARLRAEAAEANAKMSGERSRPTLEVFGLYALNSPQRPGQSDALEDSWKRNNPTSQYGVRLNMPLDISTTRRVQEGWSAEANASRTLIARKLFEQERDWSDLVAHFQLAKEKIRLYEELESSQREKLEYERSRQKAGRSTVAQVIIFETDYQQTQFSRIRSLADVLSFNAQMKLYGVAYDAPKSAGGSDAIE